MTRLAEMFNVNHFIVSQVNPHVVPFLVKEEEIVGAEAQQASAVSAGPSWVHSIANLAKGEALHRLQVLSEMGVFPNYITKARSVLNQRYSGDITIFPSISYAHFPKVLSNPTSEYMVQCMLTGERATWPKLSRVQNHVAIELALDEAIRQARARVVFSPSQIDLRLNNLSRPLSQGDENRLLPSSKKPPKVTRFKRGTAIATSSGLVATPNTSRRLNPTRSTLPPSEVVRPYLPTHPLRKLTSSRQGSRVVNPVFDTFSSSTNYEGTSSDDEMSDGDSDTSDLLSSPSPPRSPSSALPDLWPSTRQLFPYASQPATPSISNSAYGNRSTSLLNLSMTSMNDTRTKQPSSPELRYKRLFHPPPTSEDPLPNAIEPGLQREVEKAIQHIEPPLHALRQIESFPEEQTVPPPSISHTDSFPEAEMRAMDRPAIMTPALSPMSTRVGGKVSVITSPTSAVKMPPSNNSLRDDQTEGTNHTRRNHSRRGSKEGSWLGLHLDISGTRGMMLRRKKNSTN